MRAKSGISFTIFINNVHLTIFLILIDRSTRWVYTATFMLATCLHSVTDTLLKYSLFIYNFSHVCVDHFSI